MICRRLVLLTCNIDFIVYIDLGPFKWPRSDTGAVCAFRPSVSAVHILGQNREWSLQHDIDFEQLSPTKLPFFKFIWVDDLVAVAQGRSGSVALWARID